jgi:sterol desaturase/sphingolipid hydroxylase (fatty acid hydroxylase superfamily)
MDLWIFLGSLGALLAVERIASLRFEPARVRRPFAGTDLLYLLTGAVALGLAMQASAKRVVEALGGGAFALEAVPAAAAFGAALVLYDLGAYASHWMLHRVPALWRIHAVHHSSRRLDWLATFRGHVLEHALRHTLSPVALLALGFPAATVGLVAAAHGAHAAFGHSNFGPRLRWLEPVFVTPRLHRLHHVASSSERNLGTLFTLWDRLRGTLLTEPAAPLAPLGVPGELETYPQTWARQLLAPFRRHPTASPARTPARSLPSAG